MSTSALWEDPLKTKSYYLTLFFLLFVVVSVGCTPPTSGDTGIVVDVEKVVDVSLAITNEGIIVTSAGVTIPIIQTGILNGVGGPASHGQGRGPSPRRTPYMSFTKMNWATREKIFMTLDNRSGSRLRKMNGRGPLKNYLTALLWLPSSSGDVCFR